MQRKIRRVKRNQAMTQGPLFNRVVQNHLLVENEVV